MVVKAIVPALALLSFATSAGAEISCKDDVGAAKARIYVAQCIAASPATHPPCNENNPCALMIGEIMRGCQIDFEVNGAHGMKFCKRYLKSSRKRIQSGNN